MSTAFEMSDQFAVEVVHVHDQQVFGLIINNVGTLRAGRRIRVPRVLSEAFSGEVTAVNLGHEVPQRFVFSHSPGSSEWVVSSNRIGETGEVRSHIVVLDIPPPWALVSQGDTASYLQGN